MVNGKKRKKRSRVVLYAYDSDALGICVGVPLNRAGDVLLLYEAGYFCASIKNLYGIARKAIPPDRFIVFFNQRIEAAENLRRIRSILNSASRENKRVHPGRYLKGLFAKPAPKKRRKK